MLAPLKACSRWDVIIVVRLHLIMGTVSLSMFRMLLVGFPLQF